MIVTHARRADASIVSPPGKDVPGGSVLYTCSGTNEHMKKCGKLMFIWMPSARGESGRAYDAKVDHGRIEVKCRRCKTLNFIVLDEEDLA